MAFVLSSLETYVKDNMQELLVKSQFDNRFYKYMTAKGAKVQTGIKTKERIYFLDSTITFQADTGCGWNPLGSDTITDREIEVGAIKVDKEYCPKDLRPYYTQTLLNPGSLGEEQGGAWEKPVAEANASAIASTLGVAFVKGDKTSGNANLNKFDGLLKQTATGAVDANTGAITEFTPANIRSAIWAVIAGIPSELAGKDDFVIAMGADLYAMNVGALVEANLFHFAPGTVQENEMKVPGTNYTIVGFPEMNGTNVILGIRASNIYFGWDLENEEEEFEMKYNEHDKKTRFHAAFKAGVQVAFPGEVVRFDLA